MNSNYRYLWLTLLVVTAGLPLVNSTSAISMLDDDPVVGLLIRPDVLMRSRDEIGLSDHQIQQIQARLHGVGPALRAIEVRLNKAVGDLTEVLSADQIDVDAAIKRLDAIIALESEQKRAHMRVMIHIRNSLNTEQREVALRIQRSSDREGDQRSRLQKKISQIEHKIQSLARSGQPPMDAIGIMQKFPELMQKGQVREAEMLLERVVRMLSLDPDRNPNHPPSSDPTRRMAEKLQRLQSRVRAMREAKRDVSQLEQLMRRIGPLMKDGKTEEAEELVNQALEIALRNSPAGEKDPSPSDSGRKRKPPADPLSIQEVRNEVEALVDDNVAWRKIAWKTCLLDGLRASKEENKPIILWIFIDRPIDDERC